MTECGRVRALISKTFWTDIFSDAYLFLIARFFRFNDMRIVRLQKQCQIRLYGRGITNGYRWAMNTHHLEAFRAVMDSGSFTRAGERLRISQPAVSQMIAILERECGFVLFHRRKNVVTPTAEARLLFAEVERVFVGTSAIAERIKAIKAQRVGHLSIVAFPSLSARVPPSLIGGFMVNHRDVRITLENLGSRPLIDRVESQNVDLGIGMLMIDYPGVRFERLLSMEAVAVMAPSHRLASKRVVRAVDLVGEPFISMGSENRARFLIDQVFEHERVQRDIVIEAQLSEACCSLASRGLGVAIVDPLSAMEFEPRDLAVRRFRPTITFDIWLVLPQHRELSLVAKSFIQHIKGALQEYSLSKTSSRISSRAA